MKSCIILAFSWFFIIKINEVEGRRETLNDNSFVILIILLCLLHQDRRSWKSVLYAPRRIAGHVITFSFNYRALKAVHNISRLARALLSEQNLRHYRLKVKKKVIQKEDRWTDLVHKTNETLKTCDINKDFHCRKKNVRTIRFNYGS